MAAERAHYYYKNNLPDEDLSKWTESANTTCRNIGQPTVNWDNLASLFFKNNRYDWVIEYLAEPSQNLYNVIRFCETNPNCVEIEIDKRKKPNTSQVYLCGHHIFASCPSDLKAIIDSGSNFGIDKSVKVKCIETYAPEKEGNLKEFFKMVQELQSNPQKHGIVYKWRFDPGDNYEKHKHLSFILDLRRYCGDVSGLNHDADKIGSEKDLVEYVDKFHKEHVEAGTDSPPSRQVVWTLLRTIANEGYSCKGVAVGSDWDTVKNWVKTD